MALVGAAPTLISSIRDERITRGNENGIAWNVRGRLQDAASIETEIAIVWIGNVADHVIASEGPEADRAIVSVDEVAIDCQILISKRLNVRAMGEIGENVIVIAIEIARDDVREATIVIAIEIVSGINETGIAIVGTERIAAIVRMRTRKRFELRKNLWMIIQIIATRSQHRAHTSPLSNTKMIMIRRWKKNTVFRRVDPTHLRTTIMIPYKIIDLKQYMFSSCPFFSQLAAIAASLSCCFYY